MDRINLLPKWELSNGVPSVYDTQSGTYQEMVAKVYGAMRQLQLDYNGFANEINETITKFISDTNVGQEKFKSEIEKIVHDYITLLDTKIAHQDRQIEESIVYIKENLSTEVLRVVNEMKESGELDEIIGNALDGLTNRVTDVEAEVNTLKGITYELSYDESTESLTFEKTGGVE